MEVRGWHGGGQRVKHGGVRAIQRETSRKDKGKEQNRGFGKA